jgi:hypothetical protein
VSKTSPIIFVLDRNAKKVRSLMANYQKVLKDRLSWLGAYIHELALTE